MRFLLAGDSTVAVCLPQEHPMSGWGAALHAADAMLAVCALWTSGTDVSP